MADRSSGFRVCLTISGLRCACEGAPLERALKAQEGVQDATVNPLRDRASLEVDMLPRLEGILQLLASRGYPVDTSEVQITTWIGSASTQLAGLKQELLGFTNVTYCRVATPTGRVELGFALRTGWERALRDMCTLLRRATAISASKSDPILPNDE